jgi:hypothetical protein
METKDMEATMEATQKTEIEAEDFATQLERFREKTKGGHVAEAETIRLEILARHSTQVN